jgi:hypothetical protein
MQQDPIALDPADTKTQWCWVLLDPLELGPARKTQDCNFFFSYDKNEINRCEFFYIVQKLGGDFFFHLRLGWISLLKHVCFYLSKMLLKIK